MTAFSIQPPRQVLSLLDRLESAGFEAWVVGGCVRDSLLGKVPFDWDVTTSARPEETAACLEGERLLQTGAAHGTVALIPQEGRPIEITTFRADGTYTDSRHPDSVTFSRRLEDDLSRRDFTINAMAYHPGRGLVDLFGGRRDLEAALLRCVGDPARRFSEDALRILRCLRFASQLEFSIEPATGTALAEARGLLSVISQERVREELTKLLCGPGAASVLREYSQAVFAVLPELASMKGCAQETPYHCFDVWEHTLHALDHAPRQPDLRWAVLLHDGESRGKNSTLPTAWPTFTDTRRKAAELPGKSSRGCGFPTGSGSGLPPWWTTTRNPCRWGSAGRKGCWASTERNFCSPCFSSRRRTTLPKPPVFSSSACPCLRRAGRLPGRFWLGGTA